LSFVQEFRIINIEEPQVWNIIIIIIIIIKWIELNYYYYYYNYNVGYSKLIVAYDWIIFWRLL
jgi:hypothetical protein